MTLSLSLSDVPQFSLSGHFEIACKYNLLQYNNTSFQ